MEIPDGLLSEVPLFPQFAMYDTTRALPQGLRPDAVRLRPGECPF